MGITAVSVWPSSKPSFVSSSRMYVKFSRSLLHAPGLFLHDLEGGHGRGHPGRRGAGGEHEAGREVLDVVEHLALADQPAADAGQRLAEGAADQVDVVAQAEVCAVPRPPGPITPSACASSTSRRAPCFFTIGTMLVELGDLALGAEHAVGDDERALAGSSFCSARSSDSGVVVLVAHQLRAGGLPEAHAVVQRGVHVAVDRTPRCVLLLSRRGAGREVHLVAGGEDQRRLLADEGGELLLELLVQLHRAVDQARAGHARAEAIDGGLGRLAHLGVRGQAQVVVRAEHQHALAVDLRLRAVVEVERPEEGVDAHLARVVRGHELEGTSRTRPCRRCWRGSCGPAARPPCPGE